MPGRFDRQSFLGADSDTILAHTRIGVVGLGGGGSHVVQQLAHIGVGHLCIYDPDHVDAEGTNLNRLVGATEEDARLERPKTEVAARLISGVNSKIEVLPFPKVWQEHPAPLRGCSIIVGCVDSFAERHELDAFAHRHLIPYIDIGMDVHASGERFSISGQVILSFPGEPCLKCLGLRTADEPGPRYGAAGPRPQVIWPNGLLASAAVGILVGLIVPWRPRSARTVYLEYDGNSQTLESSPLLEFVRERACRHYSVDDLGDPFLRQVD